MLSFCNATQMTSPEAYTTFSPNVFDDGQVKGLFTVEGVAGVGASVPG